MCGEFLLGRGAKRPPGGRQPEPAHRVGRLAVQALEDGRVLAVHRQHFTPCSRASLMTISPAMTRISLDATAMSLPARMAASAGCRPAVPTMAISTMSAAGRVAELDQAFRSREEPPCSCRGQSRSSRALAGSVMEMPRAGCLRVCSSSSSDVVARRQAKQADPIRQILRHLDGAGADGAGAAEKNDASLRLGCVSTCRRYRYMIGALNSRLSSKSSMPPMPGKNRPESFTPASRLKSDSIRSPTTAAEAQDAPPG